MLQRLLTKKSYFLWVLEIVTSVMENVMESHGILFGKNCMNPVLSYIAITFQRFTLFLQHIDKRKKKE